MPTPTDTLVSVSSRDDPEWAAFEWVLISHLSDWGSCFENGFVYYVVSWIALLRLECFVTMNSNYKVLFLLLRPLIITVNLASFAIGESTPFKSTQGLQYHLIVIYQVLVCVWHP